VKYQAILDFWLSETDPKQWWAKDIEFDRLVTERFQSTHDAAVKGELFAWRETPKGRLAEILVLDQFSRNIYRDSPSAFAFDAQALVLAQEAIRANAQQKLPAKQKAFLYMPFMHSESNIIHDIALKLFSEPGLEHNLKFELKHKAIIDRFGRYPHRNAILGRESTEEEIAFLKQPESSF
jgi:uncharacterized protein (DUF924 family)